MTPRSPSTIGSRKSSLSNNSVMTLPSRAVVNQSALQLQAKIRNGAGAVVPIRSSTASKLSQANEASNGHASPLKLQVAENANAIEALLLAWGTQIANLSSNRVLLEKADSERQHADKEYDTSSPQFVKFPGVHQQKKRARDDARKELEKTRHISERSNGTLKQLVEQLAAVIGSKSSAKSSDHVSREELVALQERCDALEKDKVDRSEAHKDGEDFQKKLVASCQYAHKTSIDELERKISALDQKMALALDKLREDGEQQIRLEQKSAKQLGSIVSRSMIQVETLRSDQQSLQQDVTAFRKEATQSALDQPSIHPAAFDEMQYDVRRMKEEMRVVNDLQLNVHELTNTVTEEGEEPILKRLKHHDLFIKEAFPRLSKVESYVEKALKQDPASNDNSKQLEKTIAIDPSADDRYGDISRRLQAVEKWQEGDVDVAVTRDEIFKELIEETYAPRHALEALEKRLSGEVEASAKALRQTIKVMDDLTTSVAALVSTESKFEGRLGAVQQNIDTLRKNDGLAACEPMARELKEWAKVQLIAMRTSIDEKLKEHQGRSASHTPSLPSAPRPNTPLQRPVIPQESSSNGAGPMLPQQGVSRLSSEGQYFMVELNSIKVMISAVDKRYNDLTTEHVVQAMAARLSDMYPQVRDCQATMADFHHRLNHLSELLQGWSVIFDAAQSKIPFLEEGVKDYHKRQASTNRMIDDCTKLLNSVKANQAAWKDPGEELTRIDTRIDASIQDLDRTLEAVDTRINVNLVVMNGKLEAMIQDFATMIARLGNLEGA